MRLLLLVLTTCALLTAAPTAAVAKGIASAEVCGADGCHAVDAAFFHDVVADGDPLAAPPAAAPFVTVRVRFQRPPQEATHSERFTYLPSLGLVRPQDPAAGWIKLYPARRQALDALVAPTQPHPASELTGAVQPAADQARDAAPWLPILGGAAAALALFALLARYATSALKARPRASKSAN